MYCENIILYVFGTSNPKHDDFDNDFNNFA